MTSTKTTFSPQDSGKVISDGIPVLPETGFIRLPTVLKIYPISKSAWWQGIRAGHFPQGVKLGPRTTAWRVEDIRRLVSSTR
ncbi:helix-turn-helix transcriptional regulator [Noviherbaspirillum sp.]|uniref:helix-turn-helix transcriptional regulator n=1 Tax=Noviherbaspirillum sp. TaxID=1926288 RepID=UPI002B4A462E|nr:AlpA family phage regulatory protein [Noviherbaspirillum sp.]HJV81344.1 AlpA family phage regulatory protein [Noviherbaspirillum sp.]